MTKLRMAKQGKISPTLEMIAKEERVSPDELRQGVAEGKIIVPINRSRENTIKPMAIGKGLRTKVNVNLGTSPEGENVEAELEKLGLVTDLGTDTIMDLSTGGDLDKTRRLILEHSKVPLGTVPIYQAAIEAINRADHIGEMKVDDLFSVIEKHERDGVDFVTLHCGLTREAFERLRKEGRIMDVVSRGGAFIVDWMYYNDKENPLYEHFDRVLEIAKNYDLTLSLGDGLRPGSIADATDRSQIQELIILGELAKRAWDNDVQIMIEGPGHVPLHQIEANVVLEKRLCREAPFYVLGPLVTDASPGYDHITSAIGGAIAAWKGADFLCYVTPSEHLRLPTLEDTREGLIASKIAAHAGDIAKGIKGAMDRDIFMSHSRKRLDWEGQIRLSFDPERARAMRKLNMAETPKEGEVCSMCGKYCAINLMKNLKR